MARTGGQALPAVKFLAKLPRFLLTCAYLTSMIGMPAPAMPIRKGGSLFPCQNRPCGCQTAEDCRRHCCCHNDAEKIVWAEQHRVPVADVLPEPSSREWRRAPSANPPDSCRSPSSPEDRCCQIASLAPSTAKEAPHLSKALCGCFARKCGGSDGSWLALGLLSPVDRAPGVAAPSPRPEVAMSADSDVTGQSPAPATPPPKSV